MSELAAMKCEACHADAPQVTDAELAQLMGEIPDWAPTVVDGVMQLEREFTFRNFKLALQFTNRVGALAEAEGHHPEITTEWGKVRVRWWTHAIAGLHKNDFVCAAKTDAVLFLD